MLIAIFKSSYQYLIIVNHLDPKHENTET